MGERSVPADRPLTTGDGGSSSHAARRTIRGSRQLPLVAALLVISHGVVGIVRGNWLRGVRNGAESQSCGQRRDRKDATDQQDSP